MFLVNVAYFAGRDEWINQRGIRRNQLYTKANGFQARSGIKRIADRVISNQ